MAGSLARRRRIDFDFAEADAALVRAGDWDAVRAHYVARGVVPATATGYARELRDFYTLGADTLWITFARGALWWAEPEVAEQEHPSAGEGTRYRRTIGRWCNTDILGRPLAVHALSTALGSVSFCVVCVKLG